MKENEFLRETKTVDKKAASPVHLSNEKSVDEEEVWGDIIGEENPWAAMSTPKKIKQVVINISKIVLVFLFLYFFVCSLDLLSSAFSLIAGKSTGALMNNEYIENPIVGLMIGLLLTVLVQSSSTSTSIIVSMVASNMLSVDEAIPMVMGANIGTSVTNTIVSLTQVGNQENFRRAFSGATVHDMFNWMSVFVFLPLEIITGMLQHLTGAIVHNLSGTNGVEIRFLDVITSPFTELIIQLDGTIVECWGMSFMQDEDSMIKQYCETTVNSTMTSTDSALSSLFYSSYVTEDTKLTDVFDGTEVTDLFNSTSTEIPVPEQCLKNETIVGIPDSCRFLFYQTKLDDTVVGIILLCMSLFILCGSLICIVKILNSLLKGSIAKIIKKVINADIPYVPWLTGYIAIFIGAFLTFIVQSSSVFTSTLTPLIGIGIISVERAYPLTLGSNIGTTTTALLASMAVMGNKEASIQIALVHFFFNIFGILLYYPIPFMRVPIPMCKALGKVTSHHRWFAIFYLVTGFFLMPISIFALSLGGPAVLWGVLVSVILVILIIVLINVLQNKVPHWLPPFLRNWDFLPKFLHSLDPYDRVFTSLPCCKKCRNIPDEENQETEITSEETATRKRSSLSSCNSYETRF